MWQGVYQLEHSTDWPLTRPGRHSPTRAPAYAHAQWFLVTIVRTHTDTHTDTGICIQTHARAHTDTRTGTYRHTHMRTHTHARSLLVLTAGLDSVPLFATPHSVTPTLSHASSEFTLPGTCGPSFKLPRPPTHHSSVCKHDSFHGCSSLSLFLSASHRRSLLPSLSLFVLSHRPSLSVLSPSPFSLLPSSSVLRCSPARSLPGATGAHPATAPQRPGWQSSTWPARCVRAHVRVAAVREAAL